MTSPIVKLGSTYLPADQPVYLIQVWERPTIAPTGAELARRSSAGADGSDIGRYQRLWYTLVGDYPIYDSHIGYGIIVAGEGSQYHAYQCGAKALQIKAHEGVSILESLREEDTHPGVALLPGDREDGNTPPPKGHRELDRYLE